MDEFAKLFLSKRIERGLSQEEIAKLLHVTRQAVSKWENGKAMPDITLMPLIAQIFDISVDELLTGNEHKKVENNAIEDKKVEKPRMSIKNILPYFAPVACLLVVAIVLLCMCIPPKPTPPLPEPEPTVEYLSTYVKGETLADDSVFQAELIAGKAYYRLELFTSNYTLYITAPKGAIAYLNEERIIEFESSKTVAYKSYLKQGEFVKNENFSYDAPFDGGPAAKEYVYNSIQHEDPNIDKNLLVLDLTNCSEDDCVSEKQSVNIKPQVGFDNVVIPAHGTYFAAYSMPDVKDVLKVHRFVIKTEGIRFVYMEGHRLLNGEPEIWVRSINNSTSGLNGAGASTKEFYIAEPTLENRDRVCDLWVGFVNTSDRELSLEIEDAPIEEIEFGQRVSLKGHGIKCYPVVLKFTVRAPRILLYKFSYDISKGATGDWLNAEFYDDKCSRLSYYENPNIFRLENLDEGWRGYEAIDAVAPGDYYIFLHIDSGSDKTFVLNSVYLSVEEFTKD